MIDRSVAAAQFSRRKFLIGGVLVGLGACGTDASSGTPTTSASGRGSSDPIRRGGSLRVGIVGGSNDIVDGQYITAKPDIARLVTGWESLATYDDRFEVSFEEGLAEEIESTSPDRYVIRIRDGVEFHDGKPLTADDVVYSFRRAIDPGLGIMPALAGLLQPGGIRKLDRRTVLLGTTTLFSG